LLETVALDAVDSEVADLIDRAVTTAREAPVPEEGALLTDVYVSY
jgi:TPP-dependent pyruvate/acetoin dehydrogenase alpha subunit